MLCAVKRMVNSAMRRSLIVAVVTKAVIVAIATLGAQLAQAQLMVVDGYVRGLPPGQSVTAAFMTLRNPGDQEWVVTRAGTAVADKVEFHQHSHEGGMMRMRQVPALHIPAGGELQLAPGHMHLMLIGLRQVLNEGDTVVIELCSESSECQSIELAVVSVLNE